MTCDFWAVFRGFIFGGGLDLRFVDVGAGSGFLASLGMTDRNARATATATTEADPPPAAKDDNPMRGGGGDGVMAAVVVVVAGWFEVMGLAGQDTLAVP